MNNLIERRLFIKNLIKLLALSACPLSYSFAKEQTSNGHFLFSLKGIPFSVCCIADQELNHIQEILLPRDFETHSIESCGNDLFVLVEKWKRRACIINANKFQIHGILDLPPHAQFVGHSISHNGFVFISVADYSSGLGAGKVYVYDLKNLKKIQEIDTKGYESHQIFKINDRGYILNAGMSEFGKKVAEGNLSEIDLNHFTVLNNIPYPNYNHYAHGQVIDNNHLIVIGGQTEKDATEVDRYCRCSAAIYNVAQKNFREMELLFDDYTHVSYLSADVSADKKNAVVTAPADHFVVMFDLASGKIIKKIYSPTPGSISFSKDDKYIYLGVGESSEIVVLDRQLNELKKKKFYSKLGAHTLYI